MIDEFILVIVGLCWWFFLFLFVFKFRDLDCLVI